MRRSSNEKLSRWLSPGIVPWLAWWCVFWSGLSLAAPVEFPLEDGPLTLVDVSTNVAVQLRAVRFNTGSKQWNVDLVLSNRGLDRIAGPLVVRLEDNGGLVQIPPGFKATADGRGFLELITTAGVPLDPGRMTASRTLILGPSKLPPPIRLVPYARPILGAAALIRTLNEVGQPLPSVTIRETSVRGVRTIISDSRFGLATLGPGAGEYRIRAERMGDEPVATFPIWARIQVASAGVGLAAVPVMTPRSQSDRGILGAGINSLTTRDGSLRWQGTGATTVELTSLRAQAVPAALPWGWSPLRAAFVELGNLPLADGRLTVFLPLGTSVTSEERAQLVRWDEAAFVWRAVVSVPGRGSESLEFPLTRSGVYAVAVPDQGPTAPLIPGVGATLSASSETVVVGAGLVAKGKVTPSSSPASVQPDLVTTVGEVTFQNPAGALPSGTVLLCEISEEYRLRDGTRRVTPRYQKFVTGYQRPGLPTAGSLTATFPLRPLLLFPGDELDEAVVQVEVLPDGAIAAQLLEPSGGRVTDGDVTLVASAGTLAAPEGVLLRRYSPDVWSQVPTGGLPVVAAMEVGIGPELEGRRLTLQIAGLGTHDSLVLARTVYADGRFGVQPVERLITGLDGQLKSAEPTAGERLPGLEGAGQYLLLRVTSGQGIISGIVRNREGQPAPGLQVHSGPWLAVTDATGRYQVLGLVGDTTVEVFDPRSGDKARASVKLAEVTRPTTVDLSVGLHGPVVVESSPAEGAIEVPRVAALSVTFDKALAPGTLVPSGAVQLLTDVGTNLPVTVSLNLARTTLTVLPSAQLPGNERLTLRLASTLTDTLGLPLEGAREFSFTTETDVLRRADGTLVSLEPRNGQAGLVGGPGLAEPDAPVILVNETSGITSTVLSKPDGSFSNNIPADLNDDLRAVVVNRNGTRNSLRVGRQEFVDGSVGLFEGGGTVSAEVEGRTVNLRVEAGAISGRTVFKMEPVSSEVVRDLARVFPPSEGKFVTPGIKFSVGDQPLQGALDLEFPISQAELEAGGLKPGENPANSVFALVAVVPTGGTLGYVIIDQMAYENGRLVTHTTPISRLALHRAAAKATGTTPVTDVAAFPRLESVFSATRDKNLEVQLFIRENGTEIAELIGVAQVTRDIIRGLLAGGGAGITGAGTAGISFFAGALAQTLLLLPLQMANASVPLTMQGTVLEVDFERAAGGNALHVGEAHPLAGAMVRADDVGSGRLLSGRPGRIQPGALFSISRRNGSYTILRAGVRGAFQDLNFALSATHPRYFGVTVRELANPRIFGLLSKTDLAFFRETGASLAPPHLSVSQTPTAPEPEDTIEIEIVATATGAPTAPVRPSVEVDIGRLQAIAGSPEPRLAEVALNLVRSEDVGIQSRRLIYHLRSSVKGEVILRIAGYVPFGDRALTEYPIRFGLPVNRPEEPPPPDLVDIRGARVVRHEPAQDTRAWPVDGVIRLEFNEAMSRSLTNRPTLIRLVPAAGEPAITLSRDGRELLLAYPNLQPGEAYRLILPASIAIDASPAGNLLDQFPETPTRESFELRFQAAPQLRGVLTGLEVGGGAVVCGNYAYALERHGALDGSVIVYDLSNPGAPQKVGELSVPGFPRDLAFIRNYSFQVRSNEPPRTADLLAVAGGKLGKSFTRQGEDLGGFQYLWIIDLSVPTKPKRLASTVLSTTGSGAVNRLRWSPPHLTALISDNEFQQLDLIKLQPFIFGLNLTDAEFATMPFHSTGGTDANGDGDYVDFALGDVLPLPGRQPGGYAGRDFVFAPDPDLKARWADHDWNGRSATLGVVTFEGKDRLGAPISGAYQTLFRGGQTLDPAATTLIFNGDRPRRVTLLSDVPIPTPQGIRVGEVALLTMVSPQGQGWLATVDITEAQNPRLVASNAVPIGLGQPQSLELLADGRLAWATTSHLLILDSSRIAEVSTGGDWPALLGAVPNFGAAGRTFGLDPSGLAASASGGVQVGGMTAPQLYLVRQPGSAPPLSPAFLREIARTNLGAAGDFLNTLQSVSDLAPARLRSVPTVVDSGVFPPQRAAQYQVLVQAPGSAGATLPLLLETLNPAGHPVADKGRGFPPVRALAPDTLALIGGAPDCTAPIHSLIAHRVSDNPASSLYNTYLSVPFVLLYESLRVEELAALRSAPEPREAFWSGSAVRVGIDHALSAGNILLPYAAGLEGRSLRAGVTTIARSFAADYLMGPDPPPVTDGAIIPGTFGAVSAHNGEFRLEATDLVLPAPRLPIRFERVCGAQDLYDGPFGRGWDFFYNQRLIELRGQFFAAGTGLPLVLRSGVRSEIARRHDLLLQTGRGRTLLYQYAGDTSPSEIAQDPLFNSLGWNQSAVDFYLPPEGIFDFIVRFRDGRFARLEPDGTQAWYNPGGQLEELRDRYPDNRIFLEYDEVGALVRIVDRSASVPRFLRLGYYRLDGTGDTSFPNERTLIPAESGKVCLLRDYAGRELRFYYNACGELERREGPTVSFAHEEGFTGKPKTTYINNDTALAPSANGLGGLVAGGDAGEPLLSLSAPVNAGVPVVASTSGAGMRGNLSITLNHANTAQAIDGGNGSTLSQLPGGAETKQEFDPDGRLKVTTYSGPGAESAVESFEYFKGLLRRHTYPNGNSEIFDYFDDHPVLRSRGNLRSVTHDPGALGVAGIPRSQVKYPNFSRLYNFPVEETTDLAGHSITLTPTDDGRDIAFVDLGSDGRTERRFNQLGQITFERDVQGFTRRYEFDESSHFLKTLIEGPDDPASNLRTEFTYDSPAGRVGFNPGELGLATGIQPPKSGTLPVLLDYDEREQLITSQRGPSRLERLSYNRNGHLIRVATKVDGQRDRVILQRHAQNGFLLEQSVLEVEVDGMGSQPLITTYEPDDLFHIRSITHPGNRKIVYEEFDHLGRPKRMKNGTYVEEYTYDRQGNLLSINRGGALDTFEYDGFDRLRHKVLAVGEKGESTDYTYFPRNEMRSRIMKDVNGAKNRDQAWDVDAVGRVTLETTRMDTGVRERRWRYLELETTETELATGEIQHRKMDRAGRSRELSDSTRTITQLLDANGNLERAESHEGLLQFRSDFGHDELDQLRTASDLGGPVMRQEYRADGLVERAFDGLEQRTELSLSLLGERLRIQRPNGVEFRFGFDDGRRQVAARDRNEQGQTVDFDTEFRLSKSTLRDGSVTLHSNFDNRNQQPRRSIGSGVQMSREYDAQGRLLSRELGFAGDLRGESFSYDALDRITLATFPSGNWIFLYDLLGPLKRATLNILTKDYVIEHTLRADGAVTRLNYPAPDSLSVDLGRDSAGRLQTVLPLGPAPVVSSSSYVGAGYVGSLRLGGTNLLEQQTVFDARGRIAGRRYRQLVSGGTLMDVRYQHDPVNNISARQEIHRSSRADVFLYDSGNRLVTAHSGVRAPVAEESGRTGYVPFDLPNAAPSFLKPGYLSRSYQYDLDGLDLLFRVSEINPDGLPSLPFSRAFSGHDTFLLPQVVDGTQRGHDSLGNVSRTQLQVWEPGADHSIPVFATLRYNGLNQLIRIDRDDGISLSYDYDHAGLVVQRVLRDSRLPGGVRQTVLIWDQGRLLAEYNRTGGTDQLLARYYYFNDEVPLAMDRRGVDGVLHRFYFLTDALGHVVALADAEARVVTRYTYDAWGQFRPEAPDLTPPAVARIVATTGGLQLEFNETILPPATAVEFPGLQVGTRSFGAVAVVKADGVVVSGAWRYLETVPGRPFGSVLQFLPSRPISGSVEVRLNAGVAEDEWNNRNGSSGVAFTLTPGTPAGSVLATPSSDVPVVTPLQLSPFLFQGQLFDFEAGLIYLRARFYDPNSGSFLQRDPEAYTDSPNSYAALGHNPASLRDPSGRAVSPPGGAKPPSTPVSRTMVNGSSKAVPLHQPAAPARSPGASRGPTTVTPTTARTTSGPPPSPGAGSASPASPSQARNQVLFRGLHMTREEAADFEVNQLMQGRVESPNAFHRRMGTHANSDAASANSRLGHANQVMKGLGSGEDWQGFNKTQLEQMSDDQKIALSHISGSSETTPGISMARHPRPGQITEQGNEVDLTSLGRISGGQIDETHLGFAHLDRAGEESYLLVVEVPRTSGIRGLNRPEGDEVVFLHELRFQNAKLYRVHDFGMEPLDGGGERRVLSFELMGKY